MNPSAGPAARSRRPSRDQLARPDAAHVSSWPRRMRRCGVRRRAAIPGAAIPPAAGTSGSIADFATCQGFLSVEEVEAVTSESGLEIEVASLPGFPRTCLIAFYRPNRDSGFFLTAELYDSSEAAQERYQGFDPVPWEKLLEESPGATRREGVVALNPFYYSA